MATIESIKNATAIINLEGNIMTELALRGESGLEQQKSRTKFDNSVAYQEWVIRNEFALYPENHSADKYSQALLDKLKKPDDPREYRISVYTGKPNAFCLPNGSIYLADELIQMADADEELLFVLSHEKQHVSREHAYKSAQAQETQSVRSIVHQVISHYGQARAHEWEADLRSFNELESLGINPLGGSDLLEKFRQAAKHHLRMIDPIHGKDTDRVLNLKMMTHMQDTTTIQNPFHAVPESVKRSLSTEPGFASWHDSFIKSLDDRNVNALEKLLKNANGPVAILVLGDLIRKHEIQSKLTSDSGKRWADFQRRFITNLSQNIWSYISETLDQDSTIKLSEQQKSFLLYSLLEFTGGAEATKEENQDFFFHSRMETFKLPNGQIVQWTKRREGFQSWIHADEDIDELLDLLNSDAFTKLGVKVNFKPDSFIENVTKRALDREVYTDDEGNLDLDLFVDFANRFTDTITKLYNTHGTIDINTGDVYRTIISVAENKLPADVFSNLKEVVEAKGLETGKILSELEITEETAEAKFIKIFKSLVSELDPYSDVDLLRGREEQLQKVEAQYTPQIGKILEESGFTTQESLLAFLASFRDKFMDDPAWRRYEENDFIHNPISSLVYDLISKRYLSDESSKSIDRMLFKIKVAMFLQSNTTLWERSPLDNLTLEFEDLADKSEVTLNDYEKVYQLIEAGGLDKELGTKTHTIDILEHLDTNDHWYDALRKAIYKLLDREITPTLPKEKFNQLIEQLTTKYTFNHFVSDIEIERVGPDFDMKSEKPPFKNKVLERIFSTYQFDLANPQDLKALYFLSTYLEDTSFAVRLQEVVWQKLAEHLPFSEGLEFLQQEIKSKRLLSLRAAQSYIEQTARSHSEIKQARDVLVGFLTSDVNSADIGKLLIAEQFVDIFLSGSKPEFLLACIGNGSDDSSLKKYLYKRWREVYKINKDAAQSFINLNDFQQKLYSLDAQKKYLLIRDLLTGENGVLTHSNAYHKEQLVNFFIDNYVDATDDFEKGMRSVVREVMKETVKTAGYDLLYFALAPLLQNRLLITPPTRTSWMETIEEDTLLPEDFEEEEESESDYEDKTEWLSRYESQRKAAVQKVFNVINGTGQYEFIKMSDQARHNYQAVVEGLIGDIERRPDRLKLTVTEFIAEVAQTLGAPGVRFLQLIGQYVALPPHLEEAFRSVYDKVEGQSKITADQTLLREWPDAETKLDGLITRLGGGSLMSVFQASDDEARQRAVKILNPNSGFHAEMTYKLLTQVFTNLSQQNPQFAPALTVLDDIREWIKGDIDFTGFIEMDKRFREKHNGFSKGGRYKIKVPFSYDPENKFFSQEEYIEGINLTDMDQLTQKGHNLREVISLLTTNFYEQIKDGVVHSDIHPGNIRVTPNNEVALLDRNFYIQLSLQDRFFLAGLTQRLSDTAGVTGYCLDYLKSQGQEIDEETRGRIIEQARPLVDTPDLTNRLLGLTVLLRKEGLRFPLKITLLVKDLFYLDRMAKRVGYSGVTEALQG